MEAHGADLIDVGGESTSSGPRTRCRSKRSSPGWFPLFASWASACGSRSRLIHYKAGVARAALGLGASLVNDVSGYASTRPWPRSSRNTAPGLIADAHARQAENTCARRRPCKTWSLTVARGRRRVSTLTQSAGVLLSAIVVDPGIGFAKRPEHSYGVLARFGPDCRAVGAPRPDWAFAEVVRGVLRWMTEPAAERD